MNIQSHAQFKIFSLIQLLQKIKIGEAAKKGFFTVPDEIDMTVLFRINFSINKVLKANEESQGALAKQHSRLLKWIHKNVSVVRSELISRSQKLAKKETSEASLKVEVASKRALAVEKLLLSLTMVMCLPNQTETEANLENMSQMMQEVEELKECFGNLNLASALESGKKSKKSEAGEDQKEAFKILFDLLLSMLTNPYSFLRDMANYVFKSFCTELDEETLKKMINIVSTSNAEAAADFMEEAESDGESFSSGEEVSDEDSD